MHKGLEPPPLQKKMGPRELGMFGLEKRRLWGAIIVAFQCQGGTYRQEESGFSCGQIVIRQRGMALNLEGKFRC